MSDELEEKLDQKEPFTWPDHRKENERLRKQLEESLEVIEFYADVNNYYRDRYGDWRLDYSKPFLRAQEFLGSLEENDLSQQEEK